MIKRIITVLSSLISAIIIIGAITFGCNTTIRAAAQTAKYKIGDIITFGTYPQSRVYDSATRNKLASANKRWISYGYYSGDGDRGSMKQGDWMRYADITLNGVKYRAVASTQSRPANTWDEPFAATPTGEENVDYYVFEPLKWRVLDPESGLLLCESIIDSQAYSNTVYGSYDNYTNNVSGTHYANDYATSSIREWLNDDFINTAFTEKERQNIIASLLDNSAASAEYSVFSSRPTNDKIFLLSLSESENSAYGLSDPSVLFPSATDYTVNQGVFKSADDQNYIWGLRTAGFNSLSVCTVNMGGDMFTNANDTYVGVRPALRILKPAAESTEPEHFEPESIAPTFNNDPEGIAPTVNNDIKPKSNSAFSTAFEVILIAFVTLVIVCLLLIVLYVVSKKEASNPNSRRRQ